MITLLVVRVMGKELREPLSWIIGVCRLPATRVPSVPFFWMIKKSQKSHLFVNIS